MTSTRSYSVQKLGRWSELVLALTVEWTWGRTLAVGLAVMIVIRLAASHVMPSLSRQAGLFAWCVLGGMLALRYCSALVDGARRAELAQMAGRSRISRLAVFIIPAETIGIAKLALMTIDGCIAWSTRRPFPERPAGRHFEDLRKGFYEAMFFLNIVPFVVELPLSFLFLSVVRDLWVHVAMHSCEFLLLVLILGDRWLVHAGGHILTPTNLDLRAGARAAANLPLDSIAGAELLDKKTSYAEWRRKHGARRAETGVISILDGANVAITLRPCPQLRWLRLQVDRPMPRHLFVYVDDPAALVAAINQALSARGTPPLAGAG